MFVELIIAIFIIRHLRESLKTASLLPRWDRILKVIMYTAIALVILDAGVSYTRPVITWVAHLLMLYLIYILYSQEEFKPARQILLAFGPYILISVFTDITELTDENRYHEWKSLLKALSFFSVVWMIALWIITRRQKKALEKEQTKTKEQQEQNVITETLKAQLEVQVAERTAELTLQKEELEKTIVELKATQAQLIQSEKMASLGELTAGIAHEIQNPLNFVNNFSEVNTELIGELQQEIEKGNLEEVKTISNDIRENEQKINYHGKRADAIVKGMLQHSRSSSGQKEPTDINVLAEEYLRLAYHGLRAKDNSFNATIRTDFDKTIGKINILPQDIGRVILNLLTNAFYAVAEKNKLNVPGYEPTVSVSTRKSGNRICISVKDNGNGIPQKSLDKIFQPFFTTKPTGQGTGLGLSLSYDIINKAHGGEIKVKTKEGDGTEFIIYLPA